MIFSVLFTLLGVAAMALADLSLKTFCSAFLGVDVVLFCGVVCVFVGTFRKLL